MEEVHIKAEPYRKSNAERVRRIESERIMQAHRKGDLLVVLDERGEALDTLGFSKLIDEGRQRGSVAFAIGGPYGHDPALRKQAWKVVGLSSLVLNHDLARVVVYEQLYRALTILHGVPYHH
jgi:23S rRNA (pseudouridine1915-N3)-methyltransferase